MEALRRTLPRASERARTPGVVLAVAAACGLLLAGTAAAKRAPRPTCGDGRWMVSGTPLLAGDGVAVPEAIALATAGARRTLAIDAGCAPATATVKGTRNGTRVRVRWKQCGTARRVRLAGTLDAGCATLSGTISARGRKRHAFRAARSFCGDQVRDAGADERCEADTECSPGEHCQDCRCVLDPALASEYAYGGPGEPLPPDAIQVSPDELLARVAEGGSWLIKAELDRRAAERQAQSDADHQLVDGLIAQHPELGRHVRLVADPEARAIGHGNMLVRVDGADGGDVVLHGLEFAYRALANGIRETPQRANQERIYAAVVETLPLDRRDGLPDPSALGGLDDEAVRELVRVASRRAAELLPNTGLEDDPEQLGPRSARALQPRLSGCLNAGAGIYNRVNFPLKWFTTEVRSQGKRGTCTAHAIVAGLEAYLWKAHGVAASNLSEQELYAHAKGRWFPVTNSYEDGLSTDDTMEEMDDRNFKVHMEPAWTYNPSWDRVEDEDEEKYYDSCVDYAQTCSNTNHQMKTYCSPIGGQTYCLAQTEVEHAGTAGSEYYSLNAFTPIWNGFEPENSFDVLKGMLAAAKPVVLSLGINSAFKNSSPADPWLVSSGGSDVGYHAVLATGWVSNATVAQKAPGAPLGEGGGYVIIKNSWGCGFGDGGYVYASYDWIVEHLLEAHAVLGSGSGGVLPSVSLVASNYAVSAGGTVTLTANANSAVTRVEFYEGFTKLAEDTSPPFTHDRSFFGSQAGTHTYWAWAFDAAGNDAYSNTVEVKVDIDVTPPTCFLTADGSTETTVTAPGSVTFVANATDNRGVTKVEFFRRRKFALPAKLGEDGAAPFTGLWNYGAGDSGTYQYFAVAHDAAGNTKQSNTVEVSVIGLLPPLIPSFTATPPNLPAGGGQVTLAWSVLGASTLSVDHGVGTVTGPTGSITVPVTQSTTFTLTATNVQGTSTSQASVNVNPGLKPFIQSFTATPPALAGPGQAVLGWAVLGATALSIDQGVGDVTGLTQQSVAVGATTTFTLSATNGFGTSTKTVTVDVSAATTTTTSAPPTTATTAPPTTTTSTSTTSTTVTTLPGGPDLRPTSYTASAAVTVPGQPMTVSFSVVNQGSAAATGSWIDQLWLSADETIDNPGDLFLGNVMRTTPLPPGASYAVADQPIAIPANHPAGSYFLLLRSDVTEVVVEGNESNNTWPAPIPLALVTPDLVPTAFTASAASVVAGQQMTVSFEIENQGEGTAFGQWLDQLWLSADGVIDNPGDVFLGNVQRLGALASGAAYTVSGRTIHIPFAQPAGSYLLLLRSDAGDGVFENGQEANNTWPMPIPVTVLTPDLAVTAFDVADDTIARGAQTTVSFTVRNDGNGTAFGQWIDQLWLSADEQIDNPGDVFLGNVQRFGPLAAGASYAVAGQTITVPANLTPGSYKVLLHVDVGNALFENGADANNLPGPVTVTVR